MVVLDGATESILRIYLRRRTRASRGWLARLFATPLSHWLVKDALASGVTYATVTLGHSGYTHGAKRVATAGSDVAIETLPTCVELIAPRRTLQDFLHRHDRDLEGAVVIWLGSLAVPR